MTYAMRIHISTQTPIRKSVCSEQTVACNCCFATSIICLHLRVICCVSLSGVTDMGLLKSLGVSCIVALGQSSRKLTALEAVRLCICSFSLLTGGVGRSQRIDFLPHMFVYLNFHLYLLIETHTASSLRTSGLVSEAGSEL